MMALMPEEIVCCRNANCVREEKRVVAKRWGRTIFVQFPLQVIPVLMVITAAPSLAVP